MNNIKRKKGFGILEVLLAGVIIVIVIGALVFLARNTLNNSVYLQEKGQATFLAQEGIEIVRQIRDSNYIDKDSETKWNTLIINNSGKPSVPTDDTDYYLSFDSSLRKYQLKTSPVNSITVDNIEFSRAVRFEKNLNQFLSVYNSSGSFEPDSDMQKNALAVTVTVTWESSFKNGEVIIKELLTNSHQGM